MATMSAVKNDGILNIPMNVVAYGTDGQIGRSTNVVLNPVTEMITHLVVQLDKRPYTKYLVPIKFLGETTPASINLHCTDQQLQNELPFVETDMGSSGYYDSCV
jgi:hypothetical protein